ncbi:MAG TPA: adenylate/guanylate cyclase domain-containing protein [Burkholderiales bacterium]|nr:adenylate/guanylate cyclase domain-containing protein [Burkholderiales bacterium]
MAGTGLTPDSAAKTPRATEERRVVTVLFADVTGSTALAETSDPEDVRAVLGRYYAIAREVIDAHGGTVEKFIGDAVMAVFGMPQAHGDDAERALAAALGLRDAIARHAETATLKLRIGVNTGEVVAARASDGGDFLVTGDPVNVAARLQQQADPGAILVGERTLRAVAGFRFAARERIEIKGKREPVVAAMLLERAPGGRLQAPFLGREHDLAQLGLAAQRAFSERRPQLVTITAPAGTGKSRLVEEFAARVARNATVATAQCLPYGAAVTFLPLRGLARGLLRIDDDAEIASRLRAVFADAGYGEGDARRLSSLIGATLGDASETEKAERNEIFTAWRLLVEALATRGPLLVIFEDLHWASDTLLDLVEHVTLSRTAAPLVMITLARPDLLDRRPNWGGGRRNFTSLALEPFTQAETLRLVGLLMDGMPEQVAARIAERAGGNPFFVGELVRAYEEKREAGAVADDILLPDTVHATVLARIDALAPSERAVLEYAAVAGRSARPSSIRELLPHLAETELAGALAALVERDLITPQSSGAYTFRHIVIREVAYATLPRAERVRAHLRLARAYEESLARDGELPELVAYHYRQAISLSPGGRLPDGIEVSTVVAALERAARTASQAGAYGEARQLLLEAIRMSPRDAHQRLYELLGDLVQAGDQAVNAYNEAFKRWREAGGAAPAVGARLLIKRLGVSSRWRGSLTHPLEERELSELSAAARSLLDQSPDEILEAKLACGNAFAATMPFARSSPAADGYASHLRPVEAARHLFASRDDAEAESEALDAISAVHLRAGNFEAALAAQRERLAISERLGLLERVDAWSNAMWDLVYLGRFGDAIRTFDDARAALRPGEPEYMLVHATTWSAYAAMLSGQWDKALVLGDLLLDVREQHSDVGIGAARFTFSGWIGVMRVAAARLDTTRLARYRSAFVAIADLDRMSEPLRLLWQAMVDGDAALARAYLEQPTGARDRKGELVAMLLFDLGERLSNAEIQTVERQAHLDPAVLALRLSLARALNADAAALRGAVGQLDEAGMVADAARATALLALRTHEARDRATAEQRLAALGDRAYLQKLAEEW